MNITLKRAWVYLMLSFTLITVANPEKDKRLAVSEKTAQQVALDSTIKGIVEKEIEKNNALNEEKYAIQKENLEFKNGMVDKWLAVLSIFITLFGIGIPIYGIIYSRNLKKEIDTQRNQANDTINKLIKSSKKEIRFFNKVASNSFQKIKEQEAEGKMIVQNLSKNINLNNFLTEEEKDNYEFQADEILKSRNAMPYEKDLANSVKSYLNENYENALKESLELVDKYKNEFNLIEISEIYFRIAVCYEEIGEDDNNENAMFYYNKVLEYNPKNYKALNNLGIIYDANNQNGKAIESYKEALKHNPNDIDVLNNIGTIYGKLDKDEEAIKYYRKAIKIDDNSFTSYANLIESLLILNHLGEVEKIFDKVENQLESMHFNLKVLKIMYGIVKDKDYPKNIDLNTIYKDLTSSFNSNDIDFYFIDLKRWLETKKSKHLTPLQKEALAKLIKLIEDWLAK